MTVSTQKLPSSQTTTKFQQVCFNGKLMEVLLVWKGIVHHKFIPEGTTVNKDKYKEVLVHLWRRSCIKHHEVWVPKHWVLPA
jgi:hypothetical protein